MNAAPILVLQMQRLGDLVMTFPLLGWLQKLYPGHPVWVVGEEMFFGPLMPLSPNATYFPYSAAPLLKQTPYRLVINVSHREEAAALAGAVKSEELVGPYRCEEKLHIRGDWQLYRASLTHNNRFNLYHWVDLNALDIVPLPMLKNTVWPHPRAKTAEKEARLGLFLGASEPEKHPQAPFWAELAKKLIQLGHKPVLLGGEKEKPLGREVANILGAHALNLTGRFTVGALAEFIAELDLFITPDTGPMHVAAWTGAPTINLSMGPVSAWETGPFAPGHHILRAGIPCRGCWQCRRTRVFCREQFIPANVAALAAQVLRRERNNTILARAVSGMELLITGKDQYGLNMAKPAAEPASGPFAGRSGRTGAPFPDWFRIESQLGEFWKAWFGAVFGLLPDDAPRLAWRELAGQRLASRFREELARMARSLSLSARGAGSDFADNAFWTSFPAMLRPLAGYMQMRVRNESGSRQSILLSLSLLERLEADTA